MKKNMKKILTPIKDLDITSPNAIIKLDDDDDNNQYGWFPLDKIDLATATNLADDTDIDSIISSDIWANDNDYDVVIGFSQGCFAGAVLIANGVIKPKAFVMYSPIPILISHVKKMINTPTFIFTGEKDDLVKYDYEILKESFSNIQFHSHHQGHVIPVRSDYKNKIIDFIRDKTK